MYIRDLDLFIRKTFIIVDKDNSEVERHKQALYAAGQHKKVRCYFIDISDLNITDEMNESMDKFISEHRYLMNREDVSELSKKRIDGLKNKKVLSSSGYISSLMIAMSLSILNKDKTIYVKDFENKNIFSIKYNNNEKFLMEIC